MLWPFNSSHRAHRLRQLGRRGGHGPAEGPRPGGSSPSFFQRPSSGPAPLVAVPALSALPPPRRPRRPGPRRAQGLQPGTEGAAGDRSEGRSQGTARPAARGSRPCPPRCRWLSLGRKPQARLARPLTCSVAALTAVLTRVAQRWAGPRAGAHPAPGSAPLASPRSRAPVGPGWSPGKVPHAERPVLPGVTPHGGRLKPDSGLGTDGRRGGGWACSLTGAWQHIYFVTGLISCRVR